MARLNDSPRLFEDGGVNDRHKGSIAPDPHVDRIVDSLVLQLERAAIVDVGADVLGVGEHLMDGRRGPQAAVFSENAGAIELQPRNRLISCNDAASAPPAIQAPFRSLLY